MAQPANGNIRQYAVILAAVSSLVLGGASAARAQAWTETGDAGDLVATAQATLGTGSISSIAGNLASPTDVDVYCIQIPAVPPANLPLVQLQCVVVQGPNVWLFDATGKGVFSNSTCSGGAKTILAPNVSLAPGTYYLAVSFSGLDPQSSSGPIWLSAPPSYRAPDGPGGAGSLTGWAGTPVVQGINPYQVNLMFTSYCSAPTPALRSSWGTLKSVYR
jgi:hypothetical protein